MTRPTAASYLIVTALSLFAASPAAQVYATSPKGLLAAEGTSFADFGFGNYAAGRYVLMDGSWRGSLLAIQGLAFRADYRSHTPSSSMGRSWSRVTLDIYEGDHDGHPANSTQRQLSQIATSTPQRVFNAGVSWPSLSGIPTTQPAPFHYVFPFGRHLVYTGSRDLCADFVFTGGTMQNGAPWASTTAFPYYLDAPDANPGFSTGTERRLGASGTARGCIDQGAGFNQGAYTRSVMTSYNSQVDYKPFRDTTRLSVASYFTAPNRPVLLAITDQSHPGIPHPATNCNQLHFDPGRPWGLFAPSTTTPFGTLSALLVSATYSSAYVGKTMLTQAAWIDSATGQFRLSAASLGTLPAAPPATHPRRLCVTSSTSSLQGLATNDPRRLPLFRITR